ncbi:hypothetical protein ACNKHW_18240 [Shigella flexneri]
MGQDRHDRGAKVIRQRLFRSRFRRGASPRCYLHLKKWAAAVENDVHVVGTSSLAAGHERRSRNWWRALKRWGREDICVVAGGVIPRRITPSCKSAAWRRFIGQGTPMLDSVRDVLNLISQHHD